MLYGYQEQIRVTKMQLDDFSTLIVISSLSINFKVLKVSRKDSMNISGASMLWIIVSALIVHIHHVSNVFYMSRIYATLFAFKIDMVPFG